MEYKIVQKDIDLLIFAEYNPRQLTKEQYKDLKDSIDRFGIVDPILVNSNKERFNIIIGGHQRVKVAKDMGIKEVPTIELDLTYDKEKELNVRLNKNTGGWDFDLLANHYETDDLLNWGFKEFELGVHGDSEIDVKSEWEGMPEFENEDLMPVKTISIHFRNQKDVMEFSEFMNQKITEDTKSIWFPKLEKETFTDMDYIEK